MTLTAALIVFLSWAGTCLQILGAFVLAERWVRPTLAYAIMLVGAIAWLAAGVLKHDTAIAGLMLAYCCINLRGLTRWAI